MVPDSLAGTPPFLLAVALGAGFTVISASLAGFPISTTHGLIGALTGAGLAATGSEVNLSALKKSFFLPLLASPLIAAGMAACFYLFLNFIRRKMGVEKGHCACIGAEPALFPAPGRDSSAAIAEGTMLDVSFGTMEECKEKYLGNMAGVEAQQAVDFIHCLSAGAVGFARGVNDTPKIAALLLPVYFMDIHHGLVCLALGMAAGGLLHARKVARTMSQKITRLNHGQGLTANLVTSFLVIFASHLGMPVSTTHVSVDSLFGVGLAKRELNYGKVYEILAAWLLTLPAAAFFSGAFFYLIALTE